MHILLSVAFNALILYAIQHFLSPGVTAEGGWQLYIAGGIVLGLLNVFVKPLLKILGFPFVLMTFGLFLLVINGIILLLLEKIIHALNIAWVSYVINGWGNFAIAVAIFTLFNIVYAAFLKK